MIALLARHLRSLAELHRDCPRWCSADELKLAGMSCSAALADIASENTLNRHHNIVSDKGGAAEGHRSLIRVCDNILGFPDLLASPTNSLPMQMSLL